MGYHIHHEIRNEAGDLYDRLEKKGIIRNQEFNFALCDLKTLEELVEEYKDGDPDFDYRYMPVTRTKEGGVMWVLNYFTNDFPMAAISRYFPNETFEYKEYGESSESGTPKFCHCLIKNDTVIRDFVKEEQEKEEREKEEQLNRLKEKFEEIKKDFEYESLEHFEDSIMFDGFSLADIVELYGALSYESNCKPLTCDDRIFGEKLLNINIRRDMIENEELREAQPVIKRDGKTLCPPF